MIENTIESNSEGTENYYEFRWLILYNITVTNLVHIIQIQSSWMHGVGYHNRPYHALIRELLKKKRINEKVITKDIINTRKTLAGITTKDEFRCKVFTAYKCFI